VEGAGSLEPISYGPPTAVDRTQHLTVRSRFVTETRPAPEAERLRLGSDHPSRRRAGGSAAPMVGPPGFTTKRWGGRGERGRARGIRRPLVQAVKERHRLDTVITLFYTVQETHGPRSDSRQTETKEKKRIDEARIGTFSSSPSRGAGSCDWLGLSTKNQRNPVGIPVSGAQR